MRRAEIVGQDLIVRYLARAGPSGQQLYGSDALTATQVDQLVNFASALVSGSSLESAVAILNDYLALRTFLVGHSLSLADLACWAQLQGAATVPDQLLCQDARAHEIGCTDHRLGVFPTPPQRRSSGTC